MRGLWLLLVLLWLVLIAQHRPAPTDAFPPDVERLDLHLEPKAWVVLTEAIARARRMGYRDDASSVWVKARLRAGGQAFGCKVRLRGDYVNHWSDEKISLRVRLRGEELYRGARELNLIVAHDRAYFLEMAAEWWNRKLNLVPCPSRLVWVTLNGGDLGVYALVEELGKEQLEREGYPYAPIYKASSDHFRAGNYWENRRLVYSRACYRQKLKKAPNAEQVSRLFEELLRIYREHPRFRDAQLRRLSHLVDLDALARFSAVCRLLGSHPEHPHNATLYFNAATGLFEPILLDPEGTETHTASDFDASSHMLVFTRELLTLPAFRNRRDDHLRAIVKQLGAFTRTYDGFGRWLTLLDRDTRLWLPDRSKQDPSLEELVRVGVRYKGFFEASGRVFTKILADPARPLRPPPLDNQDARAAHLVVRMLEGDLTELHVRHGLPTAVRLAALSVRGERAGEVELIRVQPVHPVDASLRRTWRFPALQLPPARDVVLRLRGFDPARHQLQAEVVDSAGPLPVVLAPPSRSAGVHLAFLDRPLPELAAAVSNLTLLRRGPDWVVPAGTYDIRGVLIVPRGGRLILEAGARLRFGPAASLLSYAPLVVAGRPERPVVCEPRDPSRGWGLLGVLSARAWSPHAPTQTRSRVEHLVLRGARGATLNGVTYTGGLTFLGSDADVIRSCFVDVGGDDALNVKRGDVRVSECLFLDSPQDAIDLDWCTGTVERTLLAGCGGDGIDLSGAAGIRLQANVILAAKDKGVSAGEASRLELQANLLADCAIGIASKDRSRTRSRDDTLVACAEAFVAYRKKPIFGGGRLQAERPRLLGCERVTRHDSRSKVLVSGARSGPRPAGRLTQGLREAPRRTVEALLQVIGEMGQAPPPGWPWTSLAAGGP